MLKLIIQDDEGKTTVVPLIRDEITIGRKEGNTIRLTERNVSRRHARIIRSNGSVLIEDLDSYNGIRVNGTRIAGRVKVAESDRIQIGDYLLELKVDRGAQTDPFDSQATQPIEKIDSAQVTQPVPVGVATQPLSPTLVGASVATEPQAIVPTPDDKPKPRISASQPGIAPPVEPAAAAVPPVSAPTPQPSVDTPARLVVLSANFAGREFVLDKAAMVIGRTEDNDIVVNHRSISRHHAKIVKEHGRYSIVDLQSSNGVRVNGEEYGKVELRRGDLIDLGHVRIRFIEPGEDFIYDRDAPALRASAEIRRSRAPLFAVLGVVVAAGAAAFFVLGRENTPSNTVNPVTPTASEPPVGPKPTAPPTVTPTVSPGPDEGEVKKHIDAAQSSLDARKWANAIAEADKALEISKDDATARTIKERAQAELADQKNKDLFDRAAAKGDLRLMHDIVKRMDPTTSSGQEASAKLNKAQEDHGREILVKAGRAAQRGQCDYVKRLNPADWEITPVQRQKLEDLARDCAKTVAVKEGKDNRPPEPPPVTPTPSPAPQGGDPQAFLNDLQEAKLAYSNKQYQKALTKAENALDAKPGDQEAMSIAGMAACKLRNADVASKWLKRLKSQRLALVRQICLTEKVPLPEQ